LHSLFRAQRCGYVGPMHGPAEIHEAAAPRQPTLYERRVEALLSLLADSGASTRRS